MRLGRSARAAIQGVEPAGRSLRVDIPLWRAAGMPYAGGMTLALGIDLGGSKIEIIALDEHGAVLLRRRRPSPRGSYEATLAAIRELVAEAEAELGARGTVGFGTPGAISPATGLLKNSNSTWLNGRPLDRDLADAARAADRARQRRRLPGPVGGDRRRRGGRGDRVRGDPRHRRRRRPGGARRGARRAECDRRRMGPQPAALAGADELPGPPCYCGLAGCIETWLSGPGLARDYRSATGSSASRRRSSPPRRRAMQRPRRRSAATRIAWRAGSPR